MLSGLFGGRKQATGPGGVLTLIVVEGRGLKPTALGLKRDAYVEARVVSSVPAQQAGPQKTPVARATCDPKFGVEMVWPVPRPSQDTLEIKLFVVVTRAHHSPPHHSRSLSLFFLIKVRLPAARQQRTFGCAHRRGELLLWPAFRRRLDRAAGPCAARRRRRNRSGRAARRCAVRRRRPAAAAAAARMGCGLRPTAQGLLRQPVYRPDDVGAADAARSAWAAAAALRRSCSAAATAAFAATADAATAADRSRLCATAADVHASA